MIAPKSWKRVEVSSFQGHGIAFMDEILANTEFLSDLSWDTKQRLYSY